jgi:L-rhamnose mutarotase
MQRACSILHVKKDRIADYMSSHQVWPELQHAMHDAGIRNYSLFMAEDGMVIQYLEAENPKEVLRKLSQTDVSRRWEEGMAEYFDASHTLPRLDEYFHMA